MIVDTVNSCKSVWGGRLQGFIEQYALPPHYNETFDSINGAQNYCKFHEAASEKVERLNGILNVYLMYTQCIRIYLLIGLHTYTPVLYTV